MATGKAVAYALFSLQERGRLFVGHSTDVYEGMVVGIHARGNDLCVNPLKTKQLTNIRAAGSDENIILVPPIATTLEYSLEFINDDELVEVTPKSIRIRKKLPKGARTQESEPRGVRRRGRCLRLEFRQFATERTRCRGRGVLGGEGW